MNLTEFEEYKTNIKELDEDHFRIINLFENMIKEPEYRKVTSFISLLPFEWAMHIMLEERFMYESKYEHLEFHLKQHNNMSSLIKQLDKNVKNGEEEHAIRNKLKELFNMLKYHILTEDKAYGVSHSGFSRNPELT